MDVKTTFCEGNLSKDVCMTRRRSSHLEMAVSIQASEIYLWIKASTYELEYPI